MGIVHDVPLVPLAEWKKISKSGETQKVTMNGS
jgi:hypothetical protein